MKKLSRRDFVATSASMAASALAMPISAHARAKKEETSVAADKPNVLLIIADQHRIDCMGAYGNRDVRTPNLDALAADGIRFENSFCPYPVCTPSRYSMISGLYPHEHRGWTNHSTLPPEVQTFPAILRKAGYKTKAVGKMHYTPTYLAVGFDEMVLAEQNGPGRYDDDYHRALKDAGLIDGNDLEDQEEEFKRKARPEYLQTLGALPSNLPRKWHSTEWIGDQANKTVEKWGASGNLLAVGFIKPHHPFDPPKEYADQYDPEKLAMLPGWMENCPEDDCHGNNRHFSRAGLDEPTLRKVMAHYYANIQHIDDQVGRLVQALKDKGIYDQTMIIYTADHGEHMGYHHLLLKGGRMYDTTMKVPLIVKLPKGAGKGTVCGGLVNNTDLAPTILKQAGCAIPEPMKGLNLATYPDTREMIFAESHEGAAVMVRSKTRKLLLGNKPGQEVFYDLEKDPLELKNLYQDSEYKGEIAKYQDALEKWRAPGAPFKPYVDEEAPVIRQPNVPDRHDDHRRQMLFYMREKMKEDWTK